MIAESTHCRASGRLTQLHPEDKSVKKRRCHSCGAMLEVVPRKPKRGERLTGGYAAVAILPPHRAHT